MGCQTSSICVMAIGPDIYFRTIVKIENVHQELIKINFEITSNQDASPTRSYNQFM